MAKFRAHGCSVSIGGTDIGGLVTIGLPDRSKGDVEVTDGDSAGDREYLPGLREGGTVTLEYRLDPEDAGQTALETNYAGEADAEIVITLPSDAAATSPVTYTFDGYVNALGGDLPQDADEPGMGTASIKVAGAVTKDLGA